MAKTCSEFITRIKQLVGRSIGTTAALDLDFIILDALNEAQVQIVQKLPCIIDLQVTDTDSIQTVSDEYEYDLDDFEPPIAHITNIWILNGTSSPCKLMYIPRDDFDERWPDISLIGSGLPKYYTRRGRVIQFNCPISAEYSEKQIRIDYCKWPADFDATNVDDESELPNADYGLLLFAWSETLRVLAKGNVALVQIADEKLMLFGQWFNNYKSYHSLQIEESVE